MQKNKENYNASDLAGMFGIHPNTVRLYEKFGFISKAQRNFNNYRIFEELHILQMKVCRCIFGYPFTNKRIRNAGNEIIFANTKKQWDTARQCTDIYMKVIEHEIKTAQKATDALQKWANPKDDKEISLENKKISRKEAADHLGVTVEAIRNWERNGLIIQDGVGIKGETLYSNADLGRMCVIFMLLQAGYSIAAIHRSISMYDKGYAEFVSTALNNPKHEELISAGDRWLYELLKLMKAAQNIHLIIEEMRKI